MATAILLGSFHECGKSGWFHTWTSQNGAFRHLAIGGKRIGVACNVVRHEQRKWPDAGTNKLNRFLRIWLALTPATTIDFQLSW